MLFDNPQVKSHFNDLTARCDKAIEFTKNEFASMRAGRANSRLLDKIHVDYYGTMTPLQQMANISTPDARTLAISPWDKSALKLIEKAILASNIGLTPMSDGNIIRLTVPVVTEERRKELVKSIKKLCEDTKVSIRNIRRDIMEFLKKLKTDKVLSEDSEALYAKEVDKIVNTKIELVDKITKEKEQEVMSV